MLLTILIVADVVLTAGLSLIHYLKPGYKYEDEIAALKAAVEALEKSQGGPDPDGIATSPGTK